MVGMRHGRREEEKVVVAPCPIYTTAEAVDAPSIAFTLSKLLYFKDKRGIVVIKTCFLPFSWAREDFLPRAPPSSPSSTHPPFECT